LVETGEDKELNRKRRRNSLRRVKTIIEKME